MARFGKGAVVIAIAVSVMVWTAAGAVAQPKKSVVGGTEAAPGSFPFMAWIYYHDELDNRVCTVTVVASNVILTAAHCVMRPNSGPLLPPTPPPAPGPAPPVGRGRRAPPPPPADRVFPGRPLKPRRAEDGAGVG